MKRRGFTLVELLLVILMIALLMTLLIPGIVEALRNAKRARCQANLSTIGKSLLNYCSDHANQWPQRVTATTPYEWDDAWYGQLFSAYIVNPTLLYCPDSNRDMAPPKDRWDPGWTGAARQISYAILDGLPCAGGGNQDNNGQFLGPADANNSWDISDTSPTTGWNQGFRCSQNQMTRNHYGQFSTPTPMKPPPIIRPVWSAFAESRNMPIMGDLVLEVKNDAWWVNHGTVSNDNPIGMNVLYADGHADWKSADNYKPGLDSTTQVGTDATTQTYYSDNQRLWRRIWKQSDGVYLRWLMNPSDYKLPDRVTSVN